MTVTSAGRVIRIYTEDILYICLAKRGCSIYVARQGEIDEIHCKESLGDLYERLAGRGFEYAHNSYIVNLAKVEGLEKNVALLQMGREGMSEGLLLGTRFTMEESFNKERFYKNGVNIIIPSLEERQLVHDIIFAELCRGIITNNSKEQYKKIIYKYCKGKETGVILGCTEIGLLIQQNFMDVPIFDTTQIHAKKIAMYMIE